MKASIATYNNIISVFQDSGSHKKTVGVKRSKLKPTNEEASKKQRVSPPQIAKKKLQETAAKHIPCSGNKPSVKTINSSSCIRQYSRPVIPSSSPNSKGAGVKILNPFSKESGGKAKAPPKAKGKAPPKERVVSGRSLGLCDFNKIKTTARTRGMLHKTMPGFNDYIYKQSAKLAVDQILKPKKNTEKHTATSATLVEHSNSVQKTEVEKRVVENREVEKRVDEKRKVEEPLRLLPAGTGTDVTLCNGIPVVDQQTLASALDARTVNGINLASKSYLILKVMPIVSLLIT